ncbi:Ig-like domain-containing protein [Bacillus paranthracis]|uniref:Ig-like domain-containing protein n=1 Tax=Bacillus paranthracis TaxID=2026186 RepID=UPI0035561E52
MTINLRGFPYPYKAMAGLHSDIDLTTPDDFVKMYRYLCTNRKDLPMYGEGLGLPFTTSVYGSSLSPAAGISIFNDGGMNHTRKQYETPITNENDARFDDAYGRALGTPIDPANQLDENGAPKNKTPWADTEIPKYMKLGWLDFLHSLSSTSNASNASLGLIGFTRAYAQKYLQWCQENNIKFEVCINHSNSDANIVPGAPTDTPGGPLHWTDLALQAGLRFIEYAPSGTQHRYGDGKAGATSLISPGTFADGGKFWKLTRYYWSMSGDEFIANTGSPSPWTLDRYITKTNLDRLVDNGFMEIFACHYGYRTFKPSPHGVFVTRNSPEFPEPAQAALRLFKSYQDQGKILIATTRNILQYDLAKKVTAWTEGTTGTGKEKITITNFADTQFGEHVPTVSEVRGLTWYVNDSSTAEIWINNTKVSETEIVRNPADSTGKQSIGIKWYVFTGEDYSLWSLDEVKQGYKVASITLKPTEKITRVKQQQKITAKVLNTNGTESTEKPIFTVGDSSKATIDANGVLTANAPGLIYVTAMIGDVISNKVWITIMSSNSPYTGSAQVAIDNNEVVAIPLYNANETFGDTRLQINTEEGKKCFKLVDSVPANNHSPLLKVVTDDGIKIAKTFE